MATHLRYVRCFSFPNIMLLTCVYSHAVSFHIWRTFAAAYGSDFADKAYRYHLDIKMPANRLSDYYRGLDSPQLYWLSCLRISPKQISVPDLVSIAGISNLAVLDLSDGQLYIDNRESTLDLRVFRTWTDLARTGRAFKHLRVLLLGWQENIGAWIFDLLKHFPKLDTIVMTDCKNINHRNSKEWADLAHAAGWNFWPTKRGVKHMRSHISRSSSGVSSIAYLYDMTSESGAARADAFPTARQYPLLECWLGTPRVWSHIVDDFPSTRTVFLQKNFGNRPLHVGAPDPAAQIFSETKTDAKKVATVADKLRTRRRREPCNTASGLLSDMASY